MTLNGPAGIRYPRGSTSGRHDEPLAPLVHGKAEVLRRGRRVAILAYGTSVDIALDAQRPTGVTVTVSMRALRSRWTRRLLLELERDHSHVITLEEHSLAGGFGTAVAEFVSDRGLNLRVERMGVPNVLVQHDSQDKQRALFGLNGEALAARVRQISESKSEKSVVRAR